VSGSDFYDAGPLRKLAVNLFYGWGYNFYRRENQLRTDDLLVRSKVSSLLSHARAAIEAAEVDYRREHIPVPSRANPTAPVDAVRNAQSLERLTKEIGSLISQTDQQPVPENDFILQRLRQEAHTLESLLDCDHQLVAQAELFRSMVAGRDGEWILNNPSPVHEGIRAINATLLARQNILLIRL
jgi:hypothetical protein